MERQGKEPFTNLIIALLQSTALALGVCLVPYSGIGISMWIFEWLGVSYDVRAGTSLAIGLIISVALFAWIVRKVWKRNED